MHIHIFLAIWYHKINSDFWFCSEISIWKPLATQDYVLDLLLILMLVLLIGRDLHMTHCGSLLVNIFLLEASHLESITVKQHFIWLHALPVKNKFDCQFNLLHILCHYVWGGTLADNMAHVVRVIHIWHKLSTFFHMGMTVIFILAQVGVQLACVAIFSPIFPLYSPALEVWICRLKCDIKAWVALE